MTTKKAIGAIAVAALLVLAGCSTAVPGTTTGAQTDDGAGDGGATMDSSDSAHLTFYVSDRPGAIEDFEHLNVTITKIGLHKADGGDDAEADDGDDADDGEDVESANDTTASDANADVGDVETTTVDDPNETTVDMNDTATETEEPEATEDAEETEEPEATEETEESEDDDADAGDDAADESDESSEWVMHDVDNATVDLTKLQGANATAISNVSVPAGEYDKVFVYVSEVNATLTNGESVNVKLPSSKLQLNKEFELSANSTPDFVFDINVHKAGGSGKYILRPVVSESGTGDQVEIAKVDKNGKPENPGNSGANGKNKGGGDDDDGDDDSETEDGDDESERALEATLDGQVRAGETVTLSVTDANGSVANATVAVNGETVGQTDANGTLAFEVPDTDELEVTVTSGDAEVELERKVKGGNGGGNGQVQWIRASAV